MSEQPVEDERVAPVVDLAAIDAASEALRQAHADAAEETIARREAAQAAVDADGTVRRDLMLALAKGRSYATALATDPQGDHAALREEVKTLSQQATLDYSGLVFAGTVTQTTRDVAFLLQARLADCREAERTLGL